MKLAAGRIGIACFGFAHLCLRRCEAFISPPATGAFCCWCDGDQAAGWLSWTGKRRESCPWICDFLHSSASDDIHLLDRHISKIVRYIDVTLMVGVSSVKVCVRALQLFWNDQTSSKLSCVCDRRCSPPCAHVSHADNLPFFGSPFMSRSPLHGRKPVSVDLWLRFLPSPSTVRACFLSPLQAIVLLFRVLKGDQDGLHSSKCRPQTTVFNL